MLYALHIFIMSEANSSISDIEQWTLINPNFSFVNAISFAR